MQQSEIVIAKTDKWIITAQYRNCKYDRPSRSRIYVSNSLIETGDSRIAELQAQEAALGERRFAQRGKYLDVDSLYDMLNRAIASAKRKYALEALHTIDEWSDVTGRFSRTAGCTCGCSPGVVLDRELYRDGRQLDLWLDENTTND